MSNQSETCHLVQPGLAVAAGGAQPRGCVWCSNLEGAGRMFLLLAVAGWDKGDLSRTRGFGRVIASPPPQHHDDRGFSLRSCCPCPCLPRATLQGSPPRLSPCYFWLPRGVVFGETICALLLLQAARVAPPGMGEPGNDGDPAPDTCRLYPGAPKHPCGHSWSSASSSFSPPPF